MSPPCSSRGRGACVPRKSEGRLAHSIEVGSISAQLPYPRRKASRSQSPVALAEPSAYGSANCEGGIRGTTATGASACAPTANARRLQRPMGIGAVFCSAGGTCANKEIRVSDNIRFSECATPHLFPILIFPTFPRSKKPIRNRIEWLQLFSELF